MLKAQSPLLMLMPAQIPADVEAALNGQAFRAPAWLPGGNAQTIWPALYARRYDGLPAAMNWSRERWDTPDGDFIDVDWLDRGFGASPPRAVLVLFHGLEGSSASHYAQAFAQWALGQDVLLAVPHFRGCSGELNRGPRAYHSGDWQEIDWIIRRCHARAESAGAPLAAAGVSLGGNALMRWAGELEGAALDWLGAVASVSSPLDLAASGAAIGKGFNRAVYTKMFLNTMKPKALRKLAQHPGLFDRAALEASSDLYEFDNVFTAPLHGFDNTDDYWARASAKPFLKRVRVDALCLNALNDPFVPAQSLPRTEEVGRHVTLWQPKDGGHVGFPTGRWPAHVMAMPRAVGAWLLQRVGVRVKADEWAATGSGDLG
jgi:uncharacterized protein